MATVTETSKCAEQIVQRPSPTSPPTHLYSLTLGSTNFKNKIYFKCVSQPDTYTKRINVAKRNEGRCIMNHTADMKRMSNNVAAHTSSIALRLALPQ